MDNAMSAIRRAIMDEVAGEETLMPSEPRPPAKKRKRKEYPRLDCCRAVEAEIEPVTRGR
jgi:hypothetical protein